jgi:diguanylate cyclase (GGDEF)-like protein
LPNAYAEGAQIVAERLRARIEQIHIRAFGALSASMGIATFPAHGASRSEMVMAADAALYSAKRAGRNRVHVFETASADTTSIFSSDDPLLDIVDSNM